MKRLLILLVLCVGCASGMLRRPTAVAVTIATRAAEGQRAESSEGGRQLFQDLAGKDDVAFAELIANADVTTLEACAVEYDIHGNRAGFRGCVEQRTYAANLKKEEAKVRAAVEAKLDAKKDK